MFRVNMLAAIIVLHDMCFGCYFPSQWQNNQNNLNHFPKIVQKKAQSSHIRSAWKNPFPRWFVLKRSMHPNMHFRGVIFATNSKLPLATLITVRNCHVKRCKVKSPRCVCCWKGSLQPNMHRGVNVLTTGTNTHWTLKHCPKSVT